MTVSGGQCDQSRRQAVTGKPRSFTVIHGLSQEFTAGQRLVHVLLFVFGTAASRGMCTLGRLDFPTPPVRVGHRRTTSEVRGLKAGASSWLTPQTYSLNGLTTMRLNVRTIYHRRLIVHTTLSGLTITRRRGTINITSHQRTIHRSGTHAANRRLIRYHLRLRLNTNVSTQNHLIRRRGHQINRRSTHSTRRLLLTLTGHTTILTSRHIMTLKRLRSGLIHVHTLNHLSGLLTHNIKAAMNGILNRHTLRRPNILRRRTGNTTRTLAYMITQKAAISRSTPNVSVMGTRRRISRHHFTTAHKASRNGTRTKFNVSTSILRRLTVKHMTGIRILGNSLTLQDNRLGNVRDIKLLLTHVRRHRRTPHQNVNHLSLHSSINSLIRQLNMLINMKRRGLRTTRHRHHKRAHSRTRTTSRNGRNMSSIISGTHTKIKRQPRGLHTLTHHMRLNIRNVRTLLNIKAVNGNISGLLLTCMLLSVAARLALGTLLDHGTLIKRLNSNTNHGSKRQHSRRRRRHRN